MLSLKERYAEDIRGINRSQAPGKPRECLKTLRHEKYLADIFEQEDAEPEIIWRLQRRFARRILKQMADLYGGVIDAGEYRKQKIEAAKRYARRLTELGLMEREFDDEWVRDRIGKVVSAERSLVPLKTTGFMPEDAALLCDRSIQDAKSFLLAIHRGFGKGRLKRQPGIYGGVDSTLCEVERWP